MCLIWLKHVASRSLFVPAGAEPDQPVMADIALGPRYNLTLYVADCSSTSQIKHPRGEYLPPFSFRPSLTELTASDDLENPRVVQHVSRTGPATTSS